MDYLFAAAQGRVNGYGRFRALKYDKETGAFAETSRFMARTWDEPRHAAVHPNNRWVYLCEEKGNKVLYFQFDHERGTLEALQELSTVPETETGYSGRLRGDDRPVGPLRPRLEQVPRIPSRSTGSTGRRAI